MHTQASKGVENPILEGNPNNLHEFSLYQGKPFPIFHKSIHIVF